MAKYNWVKRLVNKITKKDCPNNNYFWYYNHEINLQSGTNDYVDCYVDKKHNFTFDFWTRELEVMTDCEEFNKAVISAFKELYGKITIIEETEE